MFEFLFGEQEKKVADEEQEPQASAASPQPSRPILTIAGALNPLGLLRGKTRQQVRDILLRDLGVLALVARYIPGKLDDATVAFITAIVASDDLFGKLMDLFGVPAEGAK